MTYWPWQGPCGTVCPGIWPGFAGGWCNRHQCPCPEPGCSTWKQANNKKLFSGATFHIPLTKSATLNRLLHCKKLYGDFQGLFFTFRGQNRPEPPCIFFPAWKTWLKKIIYIPNSINYNNICIIWYPQSYFFNLFTKKKTTKNCKAC